MHGVRATVGVEYVAAQVVEDFPAAHAIEVDLFVVAHFADGEVRPHTCRRMLTYPQWEAVQAIVAGPQEPPCAAS